MDGGAEQSTDGASIKPVSSLRSHFEGLNVRKASQEDGTPVKDPQKPLKEAETADGGQHGGFIRASFDIPRAESPWGGLKESGPSTPRTAGKSGRRAESPPKFGHKRPASMLIQSSPQLTPAVLVESPKSPPKGYFFNRSGSQSPERSIGNTPFAKVRELISQHSSRASTRPGSPQTDVGERPIGGHIQLGNVTAPSVDNALKATSGPPPVNRAEKPKIPAKPATFMSQELTGHAKQPRRRSHDARVSPFNTPPSSDEEVSETPAAVETASSQRKLDVVQAQQTIRKVSPQRNQTLPIREPQPVRPNDPRFMGFSKPTDVLERKDPRAGGFSSVAPRSPSRDHASSPARAHTVSERPVSRDPREFGLGTSKPTPRHVSENIRHMPPPVPPPAAPVSPHQGPVRDPRLLGFSNASTLAPTEPLPSLPPRRTGTEPLRRPSEDFNRPGARPMRQNSPSAPIDRSTKPASRTHQVEAATKLPDIIPSNALFHPPPKRNTIVDSISPSIRPVRSDSVPLTKAPILGGAKSAHKVAEAEDSDETEEAADEPSGTRTEYPDTSQTNRRSPFYTSGLQELPTKSDARVFDACGKYLCTAGYVTRVFDLSSGEQIMSLNHGETVKVTSIAFKPAADLEGEGSRIWIGNNIGEIHEIDVNTHTQVASSVSHNRREVVRILRHRKNLWTVDDEGKLFVWPAHEDGMPSLKYSHLSHKVQRGHTFSMVVQGQFWLATGKEIRIYKPGNEATFAALTSPLSQPGTGEITSGTHSGQKAYFGHTDGKVSIYSTKDFSCLGTLKASDYKISALAFVGDWLWAAFKTGKIYVYDTSSTPWKVKKDWRAHDSPISGMLLDPSSVWTLRRLQVVSIGHDNVVRLWDGMLEDDWLENAMHEHDTEYCTFREVRAAVVSWNVGACNPFDIRGDFIADAIHASDPPEILAFGFQEVVDLEDRAVTAKSILGFGKKKDPVKTEQHQSRIYREWRDYLAKCINGFCPPHYLYSELHTSSLVGLFQCVFVRQEERQHIRALCATDVKCGLKGRYGNKGALITRFVLDDSSLCFINCHLAAGQTHTSQRNNDVATILEAEHLPSERSSDARSTLFVGGGDGSQILDHEICLLNGDLNYRIDAIPRDTVINMIKRKELSKLLERDQIMVSRRRVSGFRLGPFTELPITFAPTYKYDTGTDNYDSSEKKRAPAWCDRLLYRGPGRVKQTEYRRHEERSSDHRPVSGLFSIRVKTIDAAKMEKTRDRCHKAFGKVQRRLAANASVEYLVNSLGLGEKEARALIAEG